MDRTILHCDLNGFFASVEMLHTPELRNVPMAVGGNPKNRHGIILAKNEIAKNISAAAVATIIECWDLQKPIRTLIITGANVVHESESIEQLSLFDINCKNLDEKAQRLEEVVDRVREKYGNSAIKLAGAMKVYVND